MSVEDLNPREREGDPIKAMVESLSARRKTYIPTAMAEKRTASVATQAARSGRTTNRAVNG